MKSMTKIAALLLGMAMLFTMSACSPFGNPSESTEGTDAATKRTQTITVYQDGTPISYTVTLGEVAAIDILTMPEHYFVGAYDSEAGGTKYFDGKGLSTVVWGAGNPDTYYARFASIYDLTYSKMQYEEEPYRINYQYAGNSYKHYIPFEFSEELSNAIAGNLDRPLRVTVSLKLSNESKNWSFDTVGITNLKSGGELQILREDIEIVAGTYTEVVCTTTLSPRLVQDGLLYVYLETGSYITQNSDFFVKNISVSIEFEEPQEGNGK